MNWRELETELVNIAKEAGYDVLTVANTGDKLLDHTTGDTLSLTDLAKELEDRLEFRRKGS